MQIRDIQMLLASANYYSGAIDGDAGPLTMRGVEIVEKNGRFAWKLDRQITTFRCHRRLAEPLTRIFAEAAAHYGLAEMERLCLHIWGGCFNHRPMRGGTALSTHAWAAAVDLDPEHNQLPWGRDRAVLSRFDYDPFWTIVESEGATSLGRATNRDWMHFQFARL